MANILDKIVAKKRTEIADARNLVSLEAVQAAALSAPPARDFLGSLKASDGIGLIAEIKKASPSKGLIREDFDPPSIKRDRTLLWNLVTRTSPNRAENR